MWRLILEAGETLSEISTTLPGKIAETNITTGMLCSFLFYNHIPLLKIFQTLFVEKYE
jgi:hypothetical protein